MKFLLVFFGLIIIAVFILWLVFGGEKEYKFETQDLNVIAYQMEDSTFEYNANVMLFGFELKETEEKVSAKVSYQVTLLNGEGDTLYKSERYVRTPQKQERIVDLSLDDQFEVSSMKSGPYKIVFDIKDEISGNTITAQKTDTLKVY